MLPSKFKRQAETCRHRAFSILESNDDSMGFPSLNLEEIQEIRNPEQIIEKNHFTAHVACERKREDQNLLRFP